MRSDFPVSPAPLSTWSMIILIGSDLSIPDAAPQWFRPRKMATYAEAFCSFLREILEKKRLSYGI